MDQSVYMGEYNLANGYYQIHLCVNLILLLANLMGWTESPLFFCMATKTIADLAN